VNGKIEQTVGEVNILFLVVLMASKGTFTTGQIKKPLIIQDIIFTSYVQTAIIDGTLLTMGTMIRIYRMLLETLLLLNASNE